MNVDKFRFAVVISHPIQHYSPLFRALAEVPGLDVKVFYVCDHGIKESYDPGFGQSFAWDVPLLDGYKYEFLEPGMSLKTFSFFKVDSPKIVKRLNEFNPHAVWLHGYGQLVSWRALVWARNKAAVIYFGDSELLHKRKLIARAIKYFPLRYFFRHCDAFFTIGDRNEEYYLHYGVSKEKLYRGACPVDVKRFIHALQAIDRPTRTTIRKHYGLPEEALVVITLGKLIPIKRPIDVVEALAGARKKGFSIYAMMIGDGPSRSEIEKRARELGVAEQIKITGFINQKNIPYYIEAGDLLAVTSEQDAHPLSVSESLILGLPVVISDKVGCVGPTDTARPNINALIYPCGDIPSLTEALCTLASDSSLRERMKQESLNIAPTQGIHAATSIVLAILKSLKTKFDDRWADIDQNIFAGFEDDFPEKQHYMYLNFDPDRDRL
jgi:glycosyltransferase involved in cell wall biosynthesis